jgi:hypothetical protein
MQEVIWDEGGTENAEEYGSFLAGGNISFSRTLLRAVSCSSSEIFACYILPCVSFSCGVLLRDHVVVVSSSVVRRNKHCRHYTPKKQKTIL